MPFSNASIQKAVKAAKAVGLAARKMVCAYD
jgi:hypothetical protein